MNYWRTVAGQFLSNIVQDVFDSEGNVFAYLFRNPGAATAYVNFYDQPSGSVIVGTTVPVHRVAIPPAASGVPGQVIITAGPFPLTPHLQQGIAVAAVANDSDTDATAPSSPIYGEIQYA